MSDLPQQLHRIYTRLKQVQPLPDAYDVVWQGPYYIPRQGRWYPSRFTLYRGTLYASLVVAPTWHGLSWTIGSDEVEFERRWSFGDGTFGELEWARALAQIERRLQSALTNFAAYNRRVERLVPFSCRTGKLQRRLTWAKDVEPPLPTHEIEQFVGAMHRSGEPPPIEAMTLAAYLDAVAVAYDAAFEELRLWSPLDKYRRRADGRHGGLLDLLPHDAQAFAEWFHGNNWAGSHPWEIVFGHPHGIMIAPDYRADIRRWQYRLWVDSLGWYASAARMGIALAERKLPFEFHDWKKVSDALQGIDDVEVGPGLYQVSYGELKAERPDALDAIRWDPIPQLSPITPDQAARVAQGEGGEESGCGC